MIETTSIILRPPRVDDGRVLWTLLAEIGQLERNSCYTYLLLCTQFASTCVVAELDGRLLGFVLGHRPPASPEDLFVWQIGVAPDARGTGLGRRMLEAVVERPAGRDARYLTATVSSDNHPSLALFHGFARARGVRCVIGPGFPAECFATPHPDENLLRIGPLRAAS